MSVGKNIKQARESMRMTQSELAQKIEKGFSTVQKYELDLVSPPIETLKRIADVLEVSVIDLLEAPHSTPLHASQDWLQALGWKVVVYKEEGYETLMLRNDKTYEEYAITSEMFSELIESITSYSKFKIQEIIDKCKG